MKRFLVCMAALMSIAAFAAPAKGTSKTPSKAPAGDGRRGWHSDHRKPPSASKTTASSFAPKRTTPVFTGEFIVDVIFITFPDCTDIDIAQAVKDLARVRGSTITDYFKEYSQNITWPVLRAYARTYPAPHPLG